MYYRPPPHPNYDAWYHYLVAEIAKGDPALKRAVECSELNNLIMKLCLTGKVPMQEKVYLLKARDLETESLVFVHSMKPLNEMTRKELAQQVLDDMNMLLDIGVPFEARRIEVNKEILLWPFPKIR